MSWVSILILRCIRLLRICQFFHFFKLCLSFNPLTEVYSIVTEPFGDRVEREFIGFNPLTEVYSIVTPQHSSASLTVTSFNPLTEVYSIVTRGNRTPDA